MPTRTETPTNESEPVWVFRAGTQTRLVRLDECLSRSPTESGDASVPSTAWLSPVHREASGAGVTLSPAAQAVGQTVEPSGPVAAGMGQTDSSEHYQAYHGDQHLGRRHAVHPNDDSAPRPVDLRRQFSNPCGAARHNDIGDADPAGGFRWSTLWPVGLLLTLILTIRWLTAPVMVTTGPAAPTTIAIEDARLGLRAAGRNPLRGQVDAEAPEPDPATWRALKVELVKPSGYRFWAELLRPQEWIDCLVDPQTNTLELDLPEFGAVGTARVLSIDPCPTIEPGEGNIITGLFRHEAEPGTAICRIEFSNGAVIEGVTANHPIYSFDRAEFIEAGQLREGEYFQTTHGPARITRLASRAAHPGALLYNLETHREHVYQVTPDGVLVHNTCYRDVGDLPVVNKARAGVARPPRHHVFPQEHRQWFSDRGIDVDRLTITVDQGTHTALHTMGWNQTMMAALTAAERSLGRRLTSREIWDIGYRQLRSFNIRKPTFVPYND